VTAGIAALHLERALLPGGWAVDVRIEIDPAGDILAVEAGRRPDGAEPIRGAVLPGMVNVHCHAFQRAMAGLAERLEPGEASFWSWRQTMYAFLARLGPEDIGAIAAELYLELLEAGYTSVVEFHYLHHDVDGRPYADPALLSLVIHEAARQVGIGLTLLPALYVTGGFGDEPPGPGQRRFVMDPAAFMGLLERLEPVFGGDPGRRLGLAPHSLRAVPPQQLGEVIQAATGRDASIPVHIHVAEQVREVRECLDLTGRRPVERLFEIARPGSTWCLVHATHMDDHEVDLVARSGAVVGLCPTTEANLGDGTFRLADHLQLGGRLAIGSDSNVCVCPAEELRLLEYGQRLGLLRRLVAADESHPHVGARLFKAALLGGAQASGRPVGRLAPGFRADLLVLDDSDPRLVDPDGDRLLDALVFTGRGLPIRQVMVGGQWQVRDGAHPARHAVRHAFRSTMRRLLA
jgi:formimidoylglutamate deiminase